MTSDAEKGQSGRDWYLGVLRGQTGAIAQSILLGMIAAASTVPIFLLVRFALDTAIAGSNIRQLILAGGAIVLLRLAGATLYMAALQPLLRRVRAIVADLRCTLMAHVLRLQWRELGLLPEARAHLRISNDAEDVERMTHALFVSALPSLLPLLCYLAVLAHLSWPLLLTTGVAGLAARGLSFLAARKLKGSIGRFQQAYEEMHVGIVRAVQLLPATRLHASEKSTMDRHRARVVDVRDAGVEMAMAGVRQGQASGLGMAITGAVVLIAGGAAVIAGTLTAGALAAFFVVASQASGTLTAIFGAIPQVLAGDAALARIAAFHGAGTAEPQRAEAADPAPGGTIVFDRVGFSYGSRVILRDASFAAMNGQVVAIAGPNGAGKSSLLELVLGLLVPVEGRITIDGSDLASLDSRGWRRSAGIVPQQPVFAPASVRDNILLEREPSDPDALAHSVRCAGLEPALAKLPQGIDTPMGEHGRLFSGGERQRVAIARAILDSPKLLVLDEPSNHLDAAAVVEILQALFVRPDRPTVIIATHDERLIGAAEVVYDLVDARLVRRVGHQLRRAL